MPWSSRTSVLAPATHIPMTAPELPTTMPVSRSDRIDITADQMRLLRDILLPTISGSLSVISLICAVTAVCIRVYVKFSLIEYRLQVLRMVAHTIRWIRGEVRLTHHAASVSRTSAQLPTNQPWQGYHFQEAEVVYIGQEEKLNFNVL